jgi:hypothetical protein
MEKRWPRSALFLLRKFTSPGEAAWRSACNNRQLDGQYPGSIAIADRHETFACRMIENLESFAPFGHLPARRLE